MLTALTANTRTTFLPDEFEVHFAWSWDDSAWGLCTDFADLGFVALVLGPLHIQFEWSTL